MTPEERLKSIGAVFEDKDDNEYFVSLCGTSVSFEKLERSLDIDYKIILVGGPSGSGKTYLLNKFFREYGKWHHIFMYKSNNFALESLCDIYAKISREKRDSPRVCIQKLATLDEPITIILDEAQLYSKEIIDTVRVLSNEKFLRFILAVSDDSNLAIKDEQFESRIYEKINLSRLNHKEIKYFIEEKLLLAGASNYFLKFNNKSFRLISKLTGGNIRKLNRLLNKVFTLLPSNVDDSLNVNSKKINKYIEMVAIDLQLIKKKWFFIWG